MFISKFDLSSTTTLQQFAESVRDNLRGDWWPTASLFEITTFESRQYGEQEIYFVNYLVRESPTYCILDVSEIITVGSSLPGFAAGFRVRHQACDWELPGLLTQQRSEALSSFRVVTKPSDYYTQFLNAKDITIKSNPKVDTSALKQASTIVGLMLDGRRDIADCISNAGSAFAIYPKDVPVTDLPEFAYLRGQKDIWGRTYESGEIFGLGAVKGNPVSAASEQSLIPEPQYPHQGFWVAVHELGHHLMNLCFSEQDHAIWERLHRETLEANLGLGQGLMVNVDEFFAGLATIYFSIDDNIPRRHLEHFPPEILTRLKEFYGPLQPVETDDPRYIRHVSSSGVHSPWVTGAGLKYHDHTYDYSLELPSGWEVDLENSGEMRFSGPGAWIVVRYTPLRSDANIEIEVDRLAKSRRIAWEQWTRNWDASKIETSERTGSGNSTSYWVRYRGHESTKYCEITRIERLLSTSYKQRNYTVALEGNLCGAATPFAIGDVETILRSFTP